ncbi:hypothetical protein F5Y09DRAFT_298929 [Xylaria sp. FL1042]|nr:hypothetical protein F5Y09DRAFT_298929 [Xylaria sp. FL1042]
MALRNPTLKFIQDLPLYEREKPYNLSYGTYNDGVATNVKNETREVHLTDIRGREDQFSYASNSFRFVTLPPHTTLDGTEQAAVKYLEEIREFLVSEFEADKVIIYDIRQRTSSPMSNPLPTSKPASVDESYFGGTQAPAPPVYTVHVDHTLTGGFHRMRRHMMDDELATYITKGWRARMVNVWKPEEPVSDAPLALCDLQTLSFNDLLETDQVNMKYQGEIYSVRFNPNQRFYYASDQQPTEAWVMVSFDSRDGEPLKEMKACAHGALQTSAGGVNAASPRRSVEVRAIVLNRIALDGIVVQ